MVWPAVIAAAGTLAGGFLESKGQRSVNRTNLRIAKENREWQERMSNTALQRSALDHEQAGLNRILALGKPASTPAGSLAVMQNEKKGIGEGIKGASASAYDAKIKNATLHNMWSQAGQMDATAMDQAEQANLAVKQRENLEVIKRQLEATVKKIQEDTKNSSALNSKLEAEAEFYELLGPAAKAIETFIPALKAVPLPGKKR